MLALYARVFSITKSGSRRVSSSSGGYDERSVPGDSYRFEFPRE